MKEIYLIQNEVEYREKLVEASHFFDNEPKLGTQSAEKFESLLRSLEAYESKNYPI